MEERVVYPMELYRHFKGNLYQVIGVAKHSETMEDMVVYQALYGDYGLYVRPLSMFLSEVDHNKYPQIKQTYRFERIQRNSIDPINCKTEHNRVDEEKKTDFPEQNIKQESSMSSRDQSADLQGVNEDLIDFLDARDASEKLEVLYRIKNRINDRVLCDIEMSLDLTAGEGSIEERINLIKDNLQTRAKFENSRLR